MATTLLKLSWYKSKAGSWLDLMALDLSLVRSQGVYIIWNGASPSRVVRVGQGDVSARLSAHRSDPDVLRHGSGGLFVTWADVPAYERNGIERFLADVWRPLVGVAFPNAAPVPVNSPW